MMATRLLARSLGGLAVMALPLGLSSCALSHQMQRMPSGEVGDARRQVDSPAGREVPEIGLEVEDGLTWYGPSETRDAELNAAWRETVGPEVLQPRPGDMFHDWTVSDSLTVVTWNINVGGGDLLTFLREELSLTCSASAVSTGPGFSPFVLLIQEGHRRSADLPPVRASSLIPWRITPDPRPGEQLDVVEVAERCGLALAYVPFARNGPDAPDRTPEDKGNAILSSLPLSDFVAIEIPFEAGRKVAVGASVRTPGSRRVRLVSVHLDVGSTLVRTLMSGNQTRERQAAGLIEALELHEENDAHAISTLVGGDFNTWSSRETALKRMRIAFPDSPPWDGDPTRGPFPTDHLFFRSGTGSDAALVTGSYGRLARSYYSDHRARVVRLHPM